MPGAAKPDPATYAKAYAKLPEESGFTKEGLQTLTLKAGPLDVFRAQLGITALDDTTMKKITKAALIVKLLQKGPLPTVRATARARAPSAGILGQSLASRPLDAHRPLAATGWAGPAPRPVNFRSYKTARALLSRVHHQSFTVQQRRERRHETAHAGPHPPSADHQLLTLPYDRVI
jgi:hypothetical protein